MAIQAGRHQFGMDKGRITLRTFRDGLAAQAGHDLTIEAVRWSAELVVAEDLTPASLTVTVDLGSLVVREGTGGLKPLTDRDKREIGVTARKVLKADRFPEAVFSAAQFEPGPDTTDGSADTPATDTAGTVRGTLKLAGHSGPLELRVRPEGSGRYEATTTIRQTDFGIKPYSGFLGALKVRDTVDVQVEVDLSVAAEQESAA
jgi:polyisoprenoid-binding protein YceI